MVLIIHPLLDRYNNCKLMSTTHLDALDIENIFHINLEKDMRQQQPNPPSQYISNTLPQMPPKPQKSRKKKPNSTLHKSLAATSQKVFQQNEDDTPPMKTPYMRIMEAKTILVGECLPQEFKFRDKERKEIKDNILRLMGNKKGLCKIVMVTGSPGAGKTMTTNHILKTLQQTDNYKIISLNSNKLLSRRDIQSILTYQLLPSHPQLQSQTTFQIIQCLQKQSSQHSLPPTILYIQQIELFFNIHKQACTQDFFDIFLNKNINVLMLGISNTIDAMERYCHRMKKVNAKDIVNVVFHPYNVEQLRDIIVGKLEQVSTELGIPVVLEQKLGKYIAHKINDKKKGDMRMVFEFLKQLSSIILPQDPSPTQQLPQQISITQQKITKALCNLKILKPSLLHDLPPSTQITLIAIYKYLQQNEQMYITPQQLKRSVSSVCSTLCMQPKDRFDREIQYLVDYGVVEERRKVQIARKGKFMEREDIVSVRYLLKTGFQEIRGCFERDPVFGRFFQ